MIKKQKVLLICKHVSTLEEGLLMTLKQYKLH